MKRKSLIKVAMLSVSAGLMMAQPTMANTSDLESDFSTYIASKGLNVANLPVSNINNCALCHADFDSFSTPHQFALDFMAAGKNVAAFTSIENMDSDGDGTSNVDEIKLGFFPGISCDDLANGLTIRDWPADRNLADYVDPAKPGCVNAVPDIDVQPTSLNFTTAVMGTSKPISTTISNLGAADLTVTSLAFDNNTSGDFSFGPGLPVLPLVIAPNGSVDVEVVYTPSDLGSDSGVLLVVSDSPNEEDFPISLLGEGVPPPNDCDIVSVPGGHNFGALTVGDTATQTFNLQNQGTTTDCIVAAVHMGPASSPDFSLSPVATPLTLGPGETLPVDVSYTPGEVGDDVGTLDVESNAINSPVSMSLSGSGQGAPPPMVPDITVSPLQIDFSGVMIGNSVMHTATVTNDGTDLLTIDGVSLTTGSNFAFVADLPVVLAPGASMDIQVTFTPTSEGTLTDTLSISSNDPDESVVPVILSGVGQTPPPLECNIVVNPIAAEFGNVLVNTAKTLDISINNTGTADCDVNTILDGSSSPDFSIAAAPAQLTGMLAPGGKVTVSVDYFPGEAGGDTGMLTVQSNDPDTASVMVSLTGSGFMSNGGGILDVREFEADLAPGMNLLMKAAPTQGEAEVEFNESGTEANIKMSLNSREGKSGKRRAGNGTSGVNILGAALYCGEPGVGQELVSVLDMSGDGGVPVLKRWTFKGMLRDGDAGINTTTDCGATLYDIALSMLNGDVYAVIHADTGDLVGQLMPDEMDDDGDDETDGEDDASENPKTKVRK